MAIVVPNKLKKFDNVKTKEEMIEELKGYKAFLSSYYYDYFRSLVELQFSIFNKNISEEEKKRLSELDIYREIAKYNIYNQAIDLVKDEDATFNGNEQKYEGLIIYVDDNRVFDFSYRAKYCDPKAIEGFKRSDVGTISLFQTLDSRPSYEEEISILKEKILEEENAKCPSNILDYITWKSNHEERLSSLRAELEELLDDSSYQDDQRRSEASNRIRDKFMELYGISEEELIPENVDYDSNCTKKIKKIPGIVLTNYVYHL